MSTTSMTVPGRTIEGSTSLSIRRVTPEYHKTLRIPLRTGRLFDATDRTGGANVVIINESAAKKYFPGENPLGRSVNLHNADRTIVGVVGDIYPVSLEGTQGAEVTCGLIHRLFQAEVHTANPR